MVKVIKIVDDIYFVPMTSGKDTTFIGWLSFTYDGVFCVKSVSVFKREGGGIRLEYPKQVFEHNGTTKVRQLVYPATNKLGSQIEKDIYTYLKVNAILDENDNPKPKGENDEESRD